MNRNTLHADVIDSFYSRDGYLITFDSPQWRLNKDITVPIGKISPYLLDKDYSFRRLIEFYAKTSSPGHTINVFFRMLHYCQQMKSSELFTAPSLISYRSSLNNKTEYYLGAMRGAVRQWARLGYLDISDEVLSLMDEWVIKGNEKGFAVQSMCPEDGPLTDIELQGVVAGVIEAFVTDRLTLRDTCIAMTFAMTGRRPGQIASLKLKDLVSTTSGKYWIKFPKGKQRKASWRSSFNSFAIIEDLWVLLQRQANSVIEYFATLSDKTLSTRQIQELPLFPDRKTIRQASLLDELLEKDHLHIRVKSINAIIKNVARIISVISERTGKPLNLTPTRFRYTLGTNLAREGRGEYIIAEALDHSDTQNVGVYVKNIPEIVERIDKAVTLQLAPYAQAFRGILVNSEKDAIRGNDPRSRISNGRANVGTCGTYAFCGALAPIACYTCKHFQPWLDGPHEEVLDRLIEEREHIRLSSGDLKIASTNDRLILAVGDVINHCKAAKRAVHD